MLIKWGPVLAILFVLTALTWAARKRWPVITVLLYAIWVTAVFTPIILCFVFWLGNPNAPDFYELVGSLNIFNSDAWPLWIFCSILILSQMLLLIIPVKIMKQRPIPRRSFWFIAFGQYSSCAAPKGAFLYLCHFDGSENKQKRLVRF